MKNRKKLSRPGPDAAGFSLLEVVFALAIIATVGISMIGMIPMGFENVRQAADLSVESRIVQTIASDAQSSDWAEFGRRFSGSEPLMQYFDDQGTPLDDSGAFNHIYTASIALSGSPSSGQADGRVVLPGDEAHQISRSTDLRKLIVRITTLPGEEGIEALKNSDDPSDFSEHFVIVSNFKQEGENGE